MNRDPIVEEIRRVPEELAKEFDYDLGAICRSAREREHQSGREVVTRHLSQSSDGQNPRICRRPELLLARLERDRHHDRGRRIRAFDELDLFDRL